ncbi:MAG: DUF4843 domain-containing protein [Sphingobacterium sp.]|jgi:hypothetical protein|nr:DUF4843 domain-containing protein [Sphingobacterium sp.]
MKQKKFHILLAFGLFAAMYSCQKEDYLLFEGQTRVQFGPPLSLYKEKAYTFRDTLKPATFYYYPEDKIKDTVYFDIYTMGNLSKNKRKYKLEQFNLSGEENAVPGKHFISFDDPSMTESYIIQPDSVHARVPIVIIRDPELKNKSVNLGIRLVNSDDFGLGETSMLWRKLIITDHLTKPVAWNKTMTDYYLGQYSTRKHQFLVETTAKKWDQDFITELSSSLDLMDYYMSIVATALADYNRQHPQNPLKDENGELITFPY